MVLLTMTSSIVDGLHRIGGSQPDDNNLAESDALDDDRQLQPDSGAPTLRDPAIGKPISHGQVVDLWKTLRSNNSNNSNNNNNNNNNNKENYSLEQLLRGSRVYCPPPPSKPEPSDEYKALMARLRHEEAQRAYERLVHPPPKVESFHDRFPTAAQAFSQVNRPVRAADLGDDDVTLNEVHRQVMLIINFLVSILGVAGTLWATARWWSLPARILLTMGGSIVVAIAEVAVYSGYMWRMDQAKNKQKANKEVKYVVNTWVLGQDDKGENDETTLGSKERGEENSTVRKRATTAAKKRDQS